MIATLVPAESLKTLPRAIWAADGASPSIYRGTPLEMVRAMASEMVPSDLSTRFVILAILAGLKRNRGVDIRLPDVRDEAEFAALFIYALLDRGVCRPVATDVRDDLPQWAVTPASLLADKDSVTFSVQKGDLQVPETVRVRRVQN